MVFLKIFLVLFFISNLIAGELKIAVASNVSYAINDLKEKFEKENPQIKLKIILGSSGKLSAQIKNGAPYDLFLSANMKYPNYLYTEKLTQHKPKVYARGALALVSKKDISTKNLNEILLSKEIIKIAIANPKVAPYGFASMEVLDKMGIKAQINHKLIYGESISQTIQYALSVADLGFVAKSSLFSKNLENIISQKNWKDIDTSLYSPIEQGIIIINITNDALIFYNFLFSETGKSIFKKYGYIV